jgi:hypothetical protein
LKKKRIVAKHNLTYEIFAKMQQITQTMKKQVRVVGTVCLCVSKEGFLSSQVFAEDHMQMGCAGSPFFFFILLKPAPLQMTKLVIIEYEEQVIGSVDSIISNLKSSQAVFLFEREGETVLIHASDKSNAKAAAAADVQQIPSESTLSSLQGSILQTAENKIPVPMKLILMIRPSCSKTSSPFMQYLPGILLCLSLGYSIICPLLILC